MATLTGILVVISFAAGLWVMFEISEYYNRRIHDAEHRQRRAISREEYEAMQRGQRITKKL